MKKLTFITLTVFILSSITCLSQTKSLSDGSMYNFNSRPGLVNITELNYGIGIYVINEDYSKRYFNLTTIFGVGLTKNLTGGIGVAVSSYNGGTLVPLFADFRYFFNLKKSRIFVFGDGGILLNSANTEGGLKILANLGVGWQLPVSKSISLNMGGGLFSQLRTEDREHDSFANIKMGMTYFFNRKSRN